MISSTIIRILLGAFVRVQTVGFKSIALMKMAKVVQEFRILGAKLKGLDKRAWTCTWLCWFLMEEWNMDTDGNGDGDGGERNGHMARAVII